MNHSRPEGTEDIIEALCGCSLLWAGLEATVIGSSLFAGPKLSLCEPSPKSWSPYSESVHLCLPSKDNEPPISSTEGRASKTRRFDTFRVDLLPCHVDRPQFCGTSAPLTPLVMGVAEPGSKPSRSLCPAGLQTSVV